MALVSCIMPTCNRPDFVRKGIENFLRQDYTDKELIIIVDKESDLPDIETPDNIRAFVLNPTYSLGNKRNYATYKAKGELIVMLDDDDWYAPNYISKCVETIGENDITGTNQLYFYQAIRQRNWVEEQNDDTAYIYWQNVPDKAWLFTYPAGAQPYVCGSGMCFKKEFWQRNKFPDLVSGEDTVFVSKTSKIKPHGYLNGIVAMIHGANTCSHIALRNKEFSVIDPAIVRNILSKDLLLQ